MHAPDPHAVQVEFSLAPLEVPAGTATPLGLILKPQELEDIMAYLQTLK